MKQFLKVAMACVMYISIASHAYAEDIVVYRKLLPQRFMLVDKTQQRCMLYGIENTPISYTCSSGQIDGDKEIEGDKKTPEGVYFVTGSILEELDFEEYGSKAYPLNYPNPIDILEQKTGYGIWVHGKGNSFRTKGTRGCVAFPEKDMLTLYPNFVVSYPVIIGEQVTLSDEDISADYNQVKQAVHSWSHSWSEQKNDFFTHYNSSKKANYRAFESKKRQIFSLFPFTFVDIDNPHVVRKGKYYTTWFRQYYYAPNMLIEGTRYLYWELGSDNIPRIIAEEWKPDTNSNTKANLTKRLHGQVESFLTEWKTAWEQGDLEKYISMYANDASQGAVQGSKAIAKAKQRTWKKQKPEHISIENVRVTLTSKGIQVRFKQIYQASGKYKDIGEKTLYIIPKSNSTSKWEITKETWKRMRS